MLLLISNHNLLYRKWVKLAVNRVGSWLLLKFKGNFTTKKENCIAQFSNETHLLP